MARSSGVTSSAAGARAGSFETASGFRYEIVAQRQGIRFRFSDRKSRLNGDKALPFFVGSGATARSYLIADDGWLFEAPVAYYTAETRWGLAPRYDAYPYPYLTRPVMSGCLGCHASFPALIAGTQNRYADPPFAEPGIGCERCHGPGAAHAAGRGRIVNPAKLPADQRDSICSQCHLSGEVRVRVAGTTWDTYRPGQRLSDSVKVFVRAGNDAGLTVTGHVEKLARSACKKASGDRLWCGSCHDVHATAADFRRRCIACHQAGECRRGEDCISCHMPKSPARDAQHVVYTDHSIPRRARAFDAAATSQDLVLFGRGGASDRDLGLAYAITGNRSRALPLLAKAAVDFPKDVEVLIYLAEIYRNQGRAGEAVPLYRRALELDPEQVTASVGLGSILMERSNFSGAIRLWEDALARNAGLVLVRTNLAMAYLRTGDVSAAERHLFRTLEVSPAFEPAIKALAQIRSVH